MKPLMLIGFPGGKSKLVGQIFSQPVPNSEDLVYVEPFFGGGSVYLNLPQNFKAYQCSDALPYVVNLFNLAFSGYELALVERKVMARYDLDDKDRYYCFRDHWNRLARKDPKNPLVSVGFALLAQHCANHFVRFGPNGFNQGWGGKRGLVGEAKWLEFASRQRPNSVFLQSNFKETPTGPEYFLYLDPPYSDAETAIYGQCWTREDDEALVSLIRRHDQTGGKFMLSSLLRTEDGLGRLAARLANFQQREIVKTYKSSVGRHAKKEHVEGVITNVL